MNVISVFSLFSVTYPAMVADPAAQIIITIEFLLLSVCTVKHLGTSLIISLQPLTSLPGSVSVLRTDNNFSYLAADLTHIRPSGFHDCWSDCLELVTWRTQRSGAWFWQFSTVPEDNLVQFLLMWPVREVFLKTTCSIQIHVLRYFTKMPCYRRENCTMPL